MTLHSTLFNALLIVNLGMMGSMTASANTQTGTIRGHDCVLPTSDIYDVTFFKNEYAKDPENGRRQTEDQYLKWARRFSNYWAQLSMLVTKRLCKELSLATLRLRSEDLGRMIAAEWSKHNGIRRINSGDLRRWRRAIKSSVASANAKEEISTALENIEREVALKLTSEQN